MPDEPAGSGVGVTFVAPLRVNGILRGRELAFDVALTLSDATLTLAPISGGAAAPAPIVVRYTTIEGARGSDGGV
jgi:hypothetical protein